MRSAACGNREAGASTPRLTTEGATSSDGSTTTEPEAVTAATAAAAAAEEAATAAEEAATAAEEATGTTVGSPVVAGLALKVKMYKLICFSVFY